MGLVRSLAAWATHALLSGLNTFAVSQPFSGASGCRARMPGPPPGEELPLSSDPAGVDAVAGAKQVIRNDQG